MATLYKNGAEVFRVTNERGMDWRFMSNGKVLGKRKTGSGFKVVGKVRDGMTFADLAGVMAGGGNEVQWISRSWADLLPSPVKRIMVEAPASAREARWVSSYNPGLLRARVNQGKV